MALDGEGRGVGYGKKEEQRQEYEGIVSGRVEGRGWRRKNRRER